MNQMPKDPVMLLSYINMQLRDAYPSLEEFCKSMGVSQKELEGTLRAIDYVYDREKNQFK